MFNFCPPNTYSKMHRKTKKKSEKIQFEEDRFTDIELPRNCEEEQCITRLAALNGQSFDFRGSIKIFDKDGLLANKGSRITGPPSPSCDMPSVDDENALFQSFEDFYEPKDNPQIVLNSTPREDSVVGVNEQIDNISSIRSSDACSDFSDYEAESSSISKTLSNKENQDLERKTVDIPHAAQRPTCRIGTPYPTVKLLPLVRQGKAYESLSTKKNPMAIGGFGRDQHYRGVRRNKRGGDILVPYPTKNARAYNMKIETVKANQNMKLQDYIKSFGEKLEAYKLRISKAMASSQSSPFASLSNKPDIRGKPLPMDIIGTAGDAKHVPFEVIVSYEKEPFKNVGDPVSGESLVPKSSLASIITSGDIHLRIGERPCSEASKTECRKSNESGTPAHLIGHPQIGNEESDDEGEVKEKVAKILDSMSLSLDECGNDNSDLLEEQNLTPSCQVRAEEVRPIRKKRRRLRKARSLKNEAKRLRSAKRRAAAIEDHKLNKVTELLKDMKAETETIKDQAQGKDGGSQGTLEICSDRGKDELQLSGLEPLGDDSKDCEAVGEEDFDPSSRALYCSLGLMPVTSIISHSEGAHELVDKMDLSSIRFEVGSLSLEKQSTREVKSSELRDLETLPGVNSSKPHDEDLNRMIDVSGPEILRDVEMEEIPADAAGSERVYTAQNAEGTSDCIGAAFAKDPMEPCCLAEMEYEAGPTYLDVYKYHEFDPEFPYPEDDLVADW